MPNELLKNGSTRFKQYLLEFLNKILEEGVVPEALNTGKCMLIYKMRMGIHDNGRCDCADVWPNDDCCRR